MGTSVVSGNGSSLTGSTTRLPSSTRASEDRKTPSTPKLTKTQVEANAYDGVQRMTSGGTVASSARLVILDFAPGARTSVRIPIEIQTSIEGQLVSRRIQIKNNGSIAASVSYDGGKIEGGGSVPVPAGGSVDLAAVPVAEGSQAVEFVLVVPT